MLKIKPVEIKCFVLIQNFYQMCSDEIERLPANTQGINHLAVETASDVRTPPAGGSVLPSEQAATENYSTLYLRIHSRYFLFLSISSLYLYSTTSQKEILYF